MRSSRETSEYSNVETFDLGKGIKTSVFGFSFIACTSVETFDLGKGIKTKRYRHFIGFVNNVETFDLGKGIKTLRALRIKKHTPVETFDLGKGIKTRTFMRTESRPTHKLKLLTWEKGLRQTDHRKIVLAGSG